MPDTSGGGRGRYRMEPHSFPSELHCIFVLIGIRLKLHCILYSSTAYRVVPLRAYRAGHVGVPRGRPIADAHAYGMVSMRVGRGTKVW